MKIRKTAGLASLMGLLLAAGAAVAEERGHEASGGEHHSKHHLAVLIGLAYEDQDGHHESGNMAGVEYIYHLNHRWGVGVGAETEVFGDHHERSGILVLPVSHFRGNWRLFGGPGAEFPDDDEEDEEWMFRLGVGYEFHLNERLTLSPEAQVDFVSGGTTVYALALALGVSF